MRPTLLLIEPNEFVRLGVAAACKSNPMCLLQATETIAEGVRLAGELAPDVIVLGVASDLADIQNSLNELLAASPDAKMLLWSDDSQQESYQSLLSNGWSGWVQRSLDVNDFLFSVRSIADGRHLYIHDAARTPPKSCMNARSLVTFGNDNTDALSEREQQVLAKLADGYTNKEIAEDIFLSVKTVETYRARLMKKLGLRSRSDLVRWVQTNGQSGYADAG